MSAVVNPASEDTVDVQSLSWENHAWSEWSPLDTVITPRKAKAPDTAGLYRLRCKGRTGLIYIGETGASLRKRFRQLRKATQNAADGKPPSPPHIAGSCVLEHERAGLVVEVSWSETKDLRPRDRKGIECELIGSYRKRMGTNPACQFGGALDGTATRN